MFVYRNITFTSFSYEDNRKRDRALNNLEPDLFKVLDHILSDGWLCEKDLIDNLRSNGAFFSYISDKRINEILLELTNRDYITRKFVLTDSDEKIKIEEKNCELPIAVTVGVK